MEGYVSVSQLLISSSDRIRFLLVLCAQTGPGGTNPKNLQGMPLYKESATVRRRNDRQTGQEIS